MCARSRTSTSVAHAIEKTGGYDSTTQKAARIACRHKTNDAIVGDDATFWERAPGDARSSETRVSSERASNDATLWRKGKNASHSTDLQPMTVACAVTAAEAQKRQEKPAGKHMPAGKAVL